MKNPNLKYGLLLLAGVALLAASCASGNKGTRPDDMSARAHRARAAKERKIARRHERAQDRGPVNIGLGGPTGIEYPIETYNPVYAHAQEAATHKRHARQHAAAATTLERFEKAQCRGFPKKSRVLCPLIGQIAAATNDARGVVLTLAPGVSAVAMLAHMQCHYAFGRKQGRQDMDRCPLYLKDIEIGPTRDGKRIFIHVTKRAETATLGKLRHRVRAHLPAASPPASKIHHYPATPVSPSSLGSAGGGAAATGAGGAGSARK